MKKYLSSDSLPFLCAYLARVVRQVAGYHYYPNCLLAS